MFFMELYKKIRHRPDFLLFVFLTSVFVSIVPARSGNRTISRR